MKLRKNSTTTHSDKGTHTMSVTVTTGNIVESTTDAIVNPANEQLLRGGGVCGAIFGAVERAGTVTQLIAACNTLRPCATGSAVTTPSFGLPSKYIIHAVGPVWRGRRSITRADLTDTERRELQLLKDVYEAILAQCCAHGITSVTIPAISTGIFGLPKNLGASIGYAVCAAQPDVSVTLIAYDEESRMHLEAAPESLTTSILKQEGLI